MLRLVVGFLPWIILGVLGDRWFVLALVLALVAAPATTLGQIHSRSLKSSTRPLSRSLSSCWSAWSAFAGWSSRLTCRCS